jgi:hypothetical protein
MTKGQTIIYATSFDANERTGVIQEVTSVGYLIDNIWYSKKDIKVKNILLDNRTVISNKQLILG